MYWPTPKILRFVLSGILYYMQLDVLSTGQYTGIIFLRTRSHPVILYVLDHSVILRYSGMKNLWKIITNFDVCNRLIKMHSLNRASELNISQYSPINDWPYMPLHPILARMSFSTGSRVPTTNFRSLAPLNEDSGELTWSIPPDVICWWRVFSSFTTDKKKMWTSPRTVELLLRTMELEKWIGKICWIFTKENFWREIDNFATYENPN